MIPHTWGNFDFVLRVVELHTSAMALYESETPCVVVDKFNGDKLILIQVQDGNDP